MFWNADSMSAAVVPGAKFEPETVKGPADPRMESPGPGRGFGDAEWMLAWEREELVKALARRELRAA